MAAFSASTEANLAFALSQEGFVKDEAKQHADTRANLDGVDDHLDAEASVRSIA